MFYDCSSLTSLDLSSFVTANGLKIGSMFGLCTNLETIYASELWNKNNIDAQNSYGVFEYCNSLKGGAGTVYNSSFTNYRYAQIDGGTSNPGYFTVKNANSVKMIERMKDGENAAVYSLSGQRLTAPQKGINIIDAKKVIIKYNRLRKSGSPLIHFV